MYKIFASFLTAIYTFLLSVGIASNGKDNWSLNIPVYEGGRICDEIYLDGSGLVSERNGKTENDSLMELISYTNLEEYNAYCEKLASEGFASVYENKINGIFANAFRKENKLYYTYLIESKKEVRIIEDNNTNSFEDFPVLLKSDEGATIYQFDYPYADFGEHRDEDIYSTNGMMYIIRLADNSLIVIDGGSIRQSSDKNIDECMKFMHKITDTAENEMVNIALWYGTHGHSDHVTFFYKLLGFHHAEINLERVMFNYPSLSLVEHDERIDMFRERLALLYPNVKYLCAHTGMSFNIKNARLDVLYTQEDAVSARSGKTPVTNTNDGSLVSMITVADKKILVLGDMNIIAQNKMVEMYDKSVFKCDIVQAAHHLYNAVAVIYNYADAEYVFCPMSEGRGALLPGNASARIFYSKDQMLYAGTALYSIKLDKNGMTLEVGHTDCVPFDDSSMNEIK